LEAVRKIKDAGKRIIFERDKIDTETVDSELLLSMIEVCEQTENEWRSENIRIGLKQRAANGTSGLYDRPCYGYYKDKNGMLAIDEKTAEVVRNIFDWYLEGASAVGIKKQLESKQIKSPKGKIHGASIRSNPSDQHEIYRGCSDRGFRRLWEPV
jgi:DNA invertase Pin-like site-specific DNA recombinase